MALRNIKRTFTSCYISRRDSFPQELIINQVDVKEIDASNKSFKNEIQNSPCDTKIIHNIPSSLIEATKEDKEKLKHVLIMNALYEYNMI